MTAERRPLLSQTSEVRWPSGSRTDWTRLLLSYRTVQRAPFGSITPDHPRARLARVVCVSVVLFPSPSTNRLSRPDDQAYVVRAPVAATTAFSAYEVPSTRTVVRWPRGSI